MPTITIKINLKKDVWNYWHACNNSSHGVDWKQKIDEKHWSHIIGKTEAEAYTYLKPILEELYQKLDLETVVSSLQLGFDKNKDRLFEIMEELTGNKIYRNDFTCFLTTIKRCPYSFDNGYVWLVADDSIDRNLMTFIHELSHFQFFAYFGENIWDQVSREQYEYIKESLTVILNGPFTEITNDIDNGYEIHKNLREAMIAHWQKHHDLQKLCDKSVELVKDKKYFK
jgi:hypothetical protein